ncbi:MAG TPA: DUF2279 domain-containing protein, partial [Chitinophagaceae bacterium]|nr:DUF2279 domain-containing protein [Chitinophagaceae bacterium]
MRCFLLLLCLSSLSVQAGDVWYRNADTLNRKRLLLTGGGQALVWSGSLLALNQAWYAQYPRTSFHLYNDAAEWMQVDKAGHAFSACWSAQLSASLFRWSGISPRRSAWYGAAMGIAYESVIEILDGFSQKWGFSIWDMASNTSGSLFFALQQHYWQEQRIDFRFSSHIIRYPESELQARANELYGQRLPERILKDYNAQTYWLSFNLKSFARSTSIPAWLNIAVGYGAQ